MKGNGFLKFAIPLSALFISLLIMMASISPIGCTTTQIQMDSYSVENFGPFLAAQTVRIRADRVTGSGTIISKKYILTALHVVQGKTTILIDIGEITGINCTVVAFGNIKSLDYAILEIEEDLPEDFEIPIAHVDFNTEFSVGRQVYFAGYPQGGSFHLTDGLLSSIDDTFYKTSAPVMFGQSGGGVYDRRGNLIGVISRMGQISNGMFQIPVYHDSYFVPIKSIFDDLLLKNQIKVFEEFKNIDLAEN